MQTPDAENIYSHFPEIEVFKVLNYDEQLEMQANEAILSKESEKIIIDESKLSDDDFIENIIFFGSIASIIGVPLASLAIILHFKDSIKRKFGHSENITKENHAKEEIYNVFRSIQEVRKSRERIRNKDPRERPDVDLPTQVRFMNGKLIKIIESLQFALLLHKEHLSDKFTRRVKDAVDGYDFLLQRLEQFPLESDDPKNVLGGDIEGFIDELKKIR